MNKRYTVIFVLFSLLMGWNGMAQKESSVLNNSKVLVHRSEDGKTLFIGLQVTSLKLRSQELLCLYPSYESEDGLSSIALSPIYIAGRGRSATIRRVFALNPHNTFYSFGLRDLKDEGDLPISLEYSIPFDRWMKKGRLRLRESLTACAECKQKQDVVTIEEVTVEPMITPERHNYSFVMPKAEKTKHIEVSFECRLSFENAKSELKPFYKDNMQHLEELDNFISKLLLLDEVTLDRILVEGYASPLGDFSYNRALSERRAAVLACYVQDKFVSTSHRPTFKVVGIGEDWMGLRESLLQSNWSEKNSVVKVIDAYSSDAEREKLIQKMNDGEVYKKLLEQYYPPLRRTVFKISYRVRPFKVQELSLVYAKNPDFLSHRELFLFAQELLKKGDENEAVMVFAAAYKRFPTDRLAQLNYANALLAYQKNAIEALGVLRDLADDPQAQLPIAMSHLLLGNEEEAERVYLNAMKKAWIKSEENQKQ